jgi:hypothetical protein
MLLASETNEKAAVLLGDLQAGFAAYHSRWQTDTFAAIRRSFSQPVWLGAQDIRGATLLLHTEQGLGDTIQFARYAQLLADRGARVVLEVEPALFTLFQTLPGVDTLLRQREALPDFDLYCPLMSLPVGCGTTLDTVPGGVPYLQAHPVKVRDWQQRLGNKTRPRIGLVQAGYRNRFGHPVPEVVARHAERDVRLVENVRCGAAHWASARPAGVDCERERSPRYWQHRPAVEVKTVN